MPPRPMPPRPPPPGPAPSPRPCRPSRRAVGWPVNDGQRLPAVARGLLAEFGRDRAGAVVAVVIDEEDTELPGVVLGEQRGAASPGRDSASFLAGTTAATAGQVRRPEGQRSGSAFSPGFRGGAWPYGRQPLAGQPEPSVRHHEVQPRGGTDNTSDREYKHTRSLAYGAAPQTRDLRRQQAALSGISRHKRSRARMVTKTFPAKRLASHKCAESSPNEVLVPMGRGALLRVKRPGLAVRAPVSGRMERRPS